MTPVTRLLTVVDVNDQPVPLDAPVVDRPAPAGVEPGLAPRRSGQRPDDPASMSLSAVHLAVLGDGRRLTLLDDRGWTSSGPPDIWRRTSVEDIEETARTVVGPDGPFDGLSQADMEADHWAGLAGTLRKQGVMIDIGELSRLPHDVELGERVRTRLTGA